MSFLPKPSLLTDFYQYTMAQAYFMHGRALTPAVFQLFIRKNPFMNPWTLACGISDLIDFVQNFRFDHESLEYLASLKNHQGATFSPQFLQFLSNASIDIDIYGMKDGQVCFPFAPILRVHGPLFLCQILETPILNIFNYQSLIATKAARVVMAANLKPVMDFGFRRAQGFDGAISASKAMFVGGISATSNLWAAQQFSIPVQGTMAHSFIMSYQNESHAFDDFSAIYPQNCILLTDTYDPILGTDKAIKTLLKLKERGFNPQGLRFDSGNLLELSKMARRKLDEHGLYECKIVASGDLDEHEIQKLEEALAPIDIYGVGTRLITAHGDAALAGVYKLAAIFDKDHFRDTGKVDQEKGSWPGIQAIDRIYCGDKYHHDFVYDAQLGPTSFKQNLKKTVEPLHHHLMSHGQALKPDNLFEAKERAKKSLASLPNSLQDLSYPYPVYFDDALLEKKRVLTLKAKGAS